jgi:hypothetical protein
MSDRVLAWALRGLWAVLPFTVWPALGAALRPDAHAVRTTAALAGWVVWGAVLVATMVPSPLALTALRCVAPAVVGAAVAAAATGRPSVLATTGAVAWSAVVAAAVFLPGTAVLCVNGPAYPNERRFPLVAPGPLLVGPIELAWAVMVALPTAGALLLAGQRWVLGGVLCALAVPAVPILARALHGLSRRWLVFVPAGVVVHDPMSLAEPVLFRRQVVSRLGPAGPAEDGLDLTLGAPGLAVELRLLEPAVLVRAGRGAGPREDGTVALRVTPSRPGEVLAYAASHQLPVHTH